MKFKDYFPRGEILGTHERVTVFAVGGFACGEYKFDENDDDAWQNRAYPDDDEAEEDHYLENYFPDVSKDELAAAYAAIDLDGYRPYRI